MDLQRVTARLRRRTHIFRTRVQIGNTVFFFVFYDALYTARLFFLSIASLGKYKWFSLCFFTVLMFFLPSLIRVRIISIFLNGELTESAITKSLHAFISKSVSFESKTRRIENLTLLLQRQTVQLRGRTSFLIDRTIPYWLMSDTRNVENKTT